MTLDKTKFNPPTLKEKDAKLLMESFIEDMKRFPEMDESNPEKPNVPHYLFLVASDERPSFTAQVTNGTLYYMFRALMTADDIFVQSMAKALSDHAQQQQEEMIAKQLKKKNPPPVNPNMRKT